MTEPAPRPPADALRGETPLARRSRVIAELDRDALQPEQPASESVRGDLVDGEEAV